MRNRRGLRQETVADALRFIDCEKWRASYADVGVEELVRTFEYKERPEIFKYYPQYYHKTDKVRLSLSPLCYFS
jgi:hypothetical protein